MTWPLRAASLGVAGFMGYVAVEYVIPFVLYGLFWSDYQAIFRGVASPVVGGVVLVAFVIVTILFRRSIPRFVVPSIPSWAAPLNVPLLNAVVAVAFIVLVVAFRARYPFSFRQTGPPLLEAGWVGVGLFAVKTYAAAFVGHLFFAFLARRGKGFESLRWWALVFGVCAGFSILAARDVVVAGVLLGFAVLPSRALWKSLVPRQEFGLSRLRIAGREVRQGLLVVSGVVLFMGAVFAGTANKRGVEDTLDAISLKSGREAVLRPLATRLGVHLGSLLNMGNEHLLDVDYQVLSVTSTSLDMAQRLCAVTGGTRCPSPPDPWSASRLTHNSLYRAYHPRAGASPGFVAGIMMFPVFPLNLITGAFLLAVLLSLIDGVAGSLRLGLTGGLLMAFLLQPLLDSPIELILRPLDPVGIYAFLILSSALYWGSPGRSDREAGSRRSSAPGDRVSAERRPARHPG